MYEYENICLRNHDLLK